MKQRAGLTPLGWFLLGYLFVLSLILGAILQWT